MSYEQKAEKLVNSDNENNANKAEHMDSNLNTSDILAYRGLGGAYGGYGGYGQQFVSDGSVVNNNVERNGDAIQGAAIQANFDRLSEAAHRTALDTQRDIADSRAEAAACCCSTKALVLEEAGKTRTLLLEQRINQLEQGNIHTQNQTNTVEIIAAVMAACNRGGGGGGS